MKRTPCIIGLAIMLSICCLALVFYDGYFLPVKPCRPIAYPGTKRVTKDLSYTTKDAFETVSAFLDNHLKTKDAPGGDIGDWVKEKIGERNYLYSCYGVDINLLTSESGCIYVRDTGNTTQINILFYRSEGSETPCPR